MQIFKRNTAKPSDPPRIEPYATTPRGYPYPLRSWAPDAAVDIQNLATAVDSDIGKLGYACVDFVYNAAPPSVVNLPATSVIETSGAGIGSIVSQKFRLTNAGTYHVSLSCWASVTGDGWATSVSTVRKYPAGQDLFVIFYDYSGSPKSWTMYLAPAEAYAAGVTMPASLNGSLIKLEAVMFISRLA